MPFFAANPAPVHFWQNLSPGVWYHLHGQRAMNTSCETQTPVLLWLGRSHFAARAPGGVGTVGTQGSPGACGRMGWVRPTVCCGSTPSGSWHPMCVPMPPHFQEPRRVRVHASLLPLVTSFTRAHSCLPLHRSPFGSPHPALLAPPLPSPATLEDPSYGGPDKGLCLCHKVFLFLGKTGKEPQGKGLQVLLLQEEPQLPHL